MSDTWIQVAEAEPAPAGKRPVYLVRREFALSSTPVRASLRASALGVYAAFANGSRVGDAVLTPGFTEYETRVQVQEYDLTSSLCAGANALVFQLGDGWFRGKLGIGQLPDNYGDRVSVFADLIVECADGSVTHIGADDQWRVGPSHIVSADLFDGQVEDRRLLDTSAYLPGFEDSSWAAPVLHQHSARLDPSISPPVRRVQAIQPVSVKEIAPGTHLVDLGQNINGWMRLSKLGAAGTSITLTHAEWLDPDTGDITLENFKVDVPFLPPVQLSQEDRVISAGIEGDVFEPEFTTHGFQYVRVEGLPGPLTVDDLVGVVVHTDFEAIGGFTCSNEDLNRLHDMAVWSFRGNACDIPTDCPTRERSGWTGDWQLYAPTASYLFDVETFSRKWLTDVVIGQHEDGRILNITPIEKLGGFDGPVGFANGGPGWGDVIVSAPLDLYMEYGTTEALQECWESACRWVDYSARVACENRHETRIARNSTAFPHEAYLRDTGFAFGEWFEPNVPVDFSVLGSGDQANHGTAYLYRSALQLSQIAEILGKSAEVRDHYANIAVRAREAWQAECMNPDGTLVVDTQASYVRALHFGLLPEDLRVQAAERLVMLIREAGTHLGTGFLSTPYLLPVLAETGHRDVAYEVLLQDTAPSWLAMIRAGATTIWELWEGVDDNGRPHESLNHYSKGAVITFLHRYVAGLRSTSPGYRTFDVRPMPGAGMTSASTWHDTSRGRIAVGWALGSDGFTLDVDVPEGSVATVYLPDGSTNLAHPGHSTFTC